MKKKIVEQAFRAGTPLTVSPEVWAKTENNIKNGEEVIMSFRNNDFFLTQNKSLNAIGIYTKEKEFVGWVSYSMIENGDKISLDKIVIADHVKHKRLGKEVLFWFRDYMNKPVYIGGAVFDDGEHFLKSLHDDPRFNVVLYDLTFKKKSKYSEKFMTSGANAGLLLEGGCSGYDQYPFPGANKDDIKKAQLSNLFYKDANRNGYMEWD